MIIAIIVIVAIAESLVYYFLFFIPEIEKTEIRLRNKKLQKKHLEKKI